MSMLCSIVRVSQSQIDAIRSQPSVATAIARGGTDDDMKQLVLKRVSSMLPDALKRMPAAQRATFEARYGSLTAEPQKILDRIIQERKIGARTPRAHPKAANSFAEIGPLDEPLQLEKSWHILHFLFTGSVDPGKPPGDFLMTGTELGEDLGYGPVRLHDVKETMDFARFLEGLNLTELQKRVSCREMGAAGVYSIPMGGGSDAQYDDELRREVASYFPSLCDYISTAAAKQAGLLIWLT
jgi:hypothetical protein